MEPPDRLASLRAASPDEQRATSGAAASPACLLLTGATVGVLAHGSLPAAPLRPPAWAPLGRRWPGRAGLALTLPGVAAAPAGTAGGLLITVAALASVASLLVIVRERMEAGQEAVRELAQRDALTGVGNHRGLYGGMSYEMARHRRSGRPLTLLVRDLDGFKAVNDTFGHPA